MTNIAYILLNRFAQVYSVSLGSQRIEFSASRSRDDGQPVVTNMVYEKLRMGDMMLSPFTLWKVKLKGTPFALSKLAPFKVGDTIDLTPLTSEITSPTYCSCFLYDVDGKQHLQLQLL